MSRKLVSFAPLMDKYVIRTKSTPFVVEERLLANSEEWKRKLQQRAAAKEAIESAREKRIRDNLQDDSQSEDAEQPPRKRGRYYVKIPSFVK